VNEQPAGRSHGEVGAKNAALSEEWKRYGRAMIQAMREVLEEEADEQVRASLLESADYWLSIGLTVGMRRPNDAARLLELVEMHDLERGGLEEDALAFCAEALE
jgi:hypothetical protein